MLSFNLLSLLRNWSPPKCFRQAVLKLPQVKLGYIETSRLQATQSFHCVTLFVKKVEWLDGQTKNSATNRELYVNVGAHSLIDVSVLSNALPHSEKCKARGFTVIVDGRKSQWNIVKTVVLMLQVHTV